jgi:hypothetical protein
MEVVGNVLHDSPAEIWRSVRAARQRENIRICDKTCRLISCNYKELDFKFRAKRVTAALMSS